MTESTTATTATYN
jgi:hypothetical protein